MASPSSPAAALHQPQTAWRSSGTRVTDPRSAVPAAIELGQPRRGIRLGDAPAAEPDHVLGLDVGSDCLLVDHWLRGDDVTAVYETADGRRLRATAMWRVHAAAADVRAWELVASAQTSLLEATPEATVETAIDAADEIHWAAIRDGVVTWQPQPLPAADCVLVRRRGRPGSPPVCILVAAHPAETGGLSVVRHGGRAVVTCRLFSAPLEKGVLLRSRVLAAIGPAGAPPPWADGLAVTFSAAPPILTT